MNANVGGHDYVLGHSDEELERLERQAELFAVPTEDALSRAGISAGMRVVDLGCGVGDVSLAAARIVGPKGSVLGVDRSRDAVQVANRRAASSGLGWVQCVEGDIFDVDASACDAVIGRFILMHLDSPVKLLARLRRTLPQRGIVAFLEMDISSASITPSMPLFERCLASIVEVYSTAGMEPDMGSKLYSTFRAAGLSPSLTGTCRVEGGPNAGVYAYLARTVASLLPTMQALGLKVDDIADVSLTDRLLDEAGKADYCVAFPRLIAAWSQV